MTTIAERIKTKQAEVLKLKEDLTNATKALDEADAEHEEAALATVEELTGQLNSATKALTLLENAEKALMERSEPAEESEDGPHSSRAPPEQERSKSGMPPATSRTVKTTTPIWLRMATTAFLAHVQKRNFDDIMAERYPGHKDLETVRMVQKAAVPLGNTYTAGWAQELVRDDVRGFLMLLARTSMAAALSQYSFNQTFDGFNSVTIPGRKPRAANNDLGGAFVGEGGAIPLGRLDIGANKLERYKMGVISTFSKELAERSTPSIEALVRECILEDMAVRLDSVVFGTAAAVTGVQPAGLLYNVTPIAGAAGGGSDAMIADIKALVGALAASGTKGIVIFMNDLDALSVSFMQNALGEMMFTTSDGTLLTFRLVTSENQPKGQITGVVAPNIATAFDNADFDVNDVATVVEADAGAAAPTHASTGAGVIGTAGQVPRDGGIKVGGGGAAAAGATTRSLWQTYSVGVRSVMPASWGLMRAGSVAAVTGITW